jgi:hypothetical protein
VCSVREGIGLYIGGKGGHQIGGGDELSHLTEV